jgi:hypothetical protein
MKALKKAKSTWKGFNNPPKSPFRKGGFKRIALVYKMIIFYYPHFLKGGRGDHKTSHLRENLYWTFAEVS